MCEYAFPEEIAAGGRQDEPKETLAEWIQEERQRINYTMSHMRFCDEKKAQDDSTEKSPWERLRKTIREIQQYRDLDLKPVPPPPTTITLTFVLTPQDRGNREGNSYFTAACQQEPDVYGYGETKCETLGDLLEELGLLLATSHPNLELEKLLGEE